MPTYEFESIREQRIHFLREETVDLETKIVLVQQTHSELKVIKVESCMQLLFKKKDFHLCICFYDNGNFSKFYATLECLARCISKVKL